MRARSLTIAGEFQVRFTDFVKGALGEWADLVEQREGEVEAEVRRRGRGGAASAAATTRIGDGDDDDERSSSRKGRLETRRGAALLKRRVAAMQDALRAHRAKVVCLVENMKYYHSRAQIQTVEVRLVLFLSYRVLYPQSLPCRSPMTPPSIKSPYFHLLFPHRTLSPTHPPNSPKQQLNSPTTTDLRPKQPPHNPNNESNRLHPNNLPALDLCRPALQHRLLQFSPASAFSSTTTTTATRRRIAASTSKRSNAPHARPERVVHGCRGACFHVGDRGRCVGLYGGLGGHQGGDGGGREEEWDQERGDEVA